MTGTNLSSISGYPGRFKGPAGQDGGKGTPGADGVNGPANVIIAAKTANYVLVLTDANVTLIRMNLAGANTLTVPPDSSVAFPIGAQILMDQMGAGQTTVTAGSGVTITSADSLLKTRVQYSGVTLIKVAANAWQLFGDLTA